MLSCSTKLCTEILLLILGYSFCTQHYILVNFCQMLLPEKASKIMCTEAALLWYQILKLLCFGTKYIGEINLRSNNYGLGQELSLWVLSWKYYVRLERRARDKRSSLFGLYVSDNKSFITFATRGGCWGRNRSKVRGRLQGRRRGRGFRQCLLRGPARTQRGQQDGAGMDTQREIVAREWVFIFLSQNIESGNRTLQLFGLICKLHRK